MKTILLSCILAIAAGVACGGTAVLDIADAGDGAATCPPRPSLTCHNRKNPPSYASDVAPTIKERCSPCHFPGGVSSQIADFETYTDVVNAQTAIIAQLYACLMPPIHGNAMYGIAPGSVPGLTAEQVNTIVDWIECGAPDN
jgi:hypothetical protein